MKANETVIRQRLAELERKHAKAIEKLQRAERSKVRRQSFHGYSLKDRIASGCKSYNQVEISPCDRGHFDDETAKSLSTHKKTISKSVSFRDNTTRDQSVSKGQSNEKNPQCALKEMPQGRSTPLLSCILKQGWRSVDSKVSCYTDDIKKRKRVSNNNSTRSQASTEFNNNIIEMSIVTEETKRKLSDQQEDQHLSIKRKIDCLDASSVDCVRNLGGTCGGSVSNLPSTKQWNDSCEEISVSKKDAVLNSKENVKQDKVYKSEKPVHSSEGNSNDLNVCEEQRSIVSNTAADVNEASVDKNGNSSEMQDSLPVKPKQNWMHLFEEEFPRRSPRLRSVSNFGKQERFPPACHDNAKKLAKRKRKHPSKSKKDLDSRNESELLNIQDQGSLQGSLRGNMDEFTFPKPSLVQTRTGGCLSVIVDFSLPDKEFAKLKLAKIKSTLSNENITCEKRSSAKSINQEKDRAILEQGKCEMDTKQDSAVLITKSPSSICGKVDDQEHMDNSASGFGTKCSGKQLLCSESIQELERNFNSPGSHGIQLKTACQQGGSLLKTSQEKLISSEMEQGPWKFTSITANKKVTDVDLNAVVISEKGHEVQSSVTSESKQSSQSCDKQSNSDCRQQKEIHVRPNTCGVVLCESQTESLHQIKNQEGVLSGSHAPPLTADEAMFQSPKQQKDQGGLLCSLQGESSLCDAEPCIDDQATPHGEMSMHSGSSQEAIDTPPVKHEKVSHIMMRACLQHHIEGDNNEVRSLALSSSYEPSTESNYEVLPPKRDVLAVCLAHLVVIWTAMPGLQWTVLHKWTLPADGTEEYLNIQFMPLKSHVALLVGGNFHDGNGRVLGYSEEDYFLDLLQDNDKKTFFLAMCLLSNTRGDERQEDMELIIARKLSHKVILTKWSLDSFCLSVKQFHTFSPINCETELMSLQPVCGSHCLLLGTIADKVFLWNHKTCQHLKSMDLHITGLGQVSCLNALTQKGLLFLILASQSSKEITTEKTNSLMYSLYALNPRTCRTVCLHSILLPLEKRPSTFSLDRHCFAVGCQGATYMWNISNPETYSMFQVFQDDVSSISFNQERQLAAFGSSSGCVHLFSFC